MNILEFADITLLKYYGRKDASTYVMGMPILRSLFKSNPQIKTTKDFDVYAKELLESISKSTKSLETKRKLLFLLALLFQELKLEHYKKLYLGKYKHYKKKILDDRKKNEPRSIKELQCLKFDLGDLRRKPINLLSLNQKSLIYYLLIFIDETPRLDYRSLVYNPTINIDTLNYLKFTSQEQYIMLNNYKTRKKYGPWKIPIVHPPLLNYLQQYIKKHQLQSNQHIFLNSKKNLYPSNKFSEFVQQSFLKQTGRRMNINCIRMLKERYLFHQNPKTLHMSLDEREKFVEKYFTHSYGTAMLYYHRIDKNKEEKKPTLISQKNPIDRFQEFQQKLNNLMKEYSITNTQAHKLFSNQSLI